MNDRLVNDDVIDVPRRAWIDAELFQASQDSVRLDELNAAIAGLRGHRRSIPENQRLGFDAALKSLTDRRAALRARMTTSSDV